MRKREFGLLAGPSILVMAVCCSSRSTARSSGASRTSTTAIARDFVGLDNYKQAFTDPRLGERWCSP